MAATPDTANDLMVVFSNTITGGFDALAGAVNGVFGLMIALVVALTGIQWALSSNRDILAAGFGKVLLIGAFAYLINDWQGLSETVWDGFIALGLTAGGGTLSRADFLNPGAILQQGWDIVRALGETPAPLETPLDVVGNLTDALILGLAMIGIILAFAVLALQIIVTLLEFKIVTLGGFVLLPFGIWSKSAFLAERPLGFVVSSGLKVLALAIVVSGARSIFDQLQPSANPDLYEALAILAASLLLAMLALFVPNLAAALVTGGPALGAGAAAAGGLAVAGAAALGGGAVAGAASAVARAGPMRAAAGLAAGRPPPRTGGAGAPPPPDPGAPFGPRAGGRGGGDVGGGGAAASRGGPESNQGPATARGGTLTGEGRPDAQPEDPAIARETSAAARAFHAAVRTPPSSPSRVQRRGSALQAFFIANAGRGLFPGNETSGALSPHLRDEET